MTNLVSLVKVFLNLLKKACDKRFPDWLPLASVDTGESRVEDASLHETFEGDRDMFREFHDNVTKPTFRIPECQCNLTNPA